LILAFTGFIGGLESWGKGIGKGMVVVMLIIFLVIAYFVFASTISPFISEIGKYPKALF